MYDKKDNVEIVGWRKVDEDGFEHMKRQVQREGGQFLILSPQEGSAADLSALPSNLSSADKGRNNLGEKQEDDYDDTRMKYNDKVKSFGYNMREGYQDSI